MFRKHNSFKIITSENISFSKKRASVPSFQLKRFIVREMHQEMNTGVMLVDLWKECSTYNHVILINMHKMFSVTLSKTKCSMALKDVLSKAGIISCIFSQVSEPASFQFFIYIYDSLKTLKEAESYLYLNAFAHFISSKTFKT